MADVGKFWKLTTVVKFEVIGGRLDEESIKYNF